MFSGRLCADTDGGPEGAVKFRDGPVGGALNTAAGPRGGDLATTGRGAGDLSRGVERADLSLSRSLKARDCGGDRSRCRDGDRGLISSRAGACVRCTRSGCMCGEESRDVVVEVLGEDLSDRGRGGEGDRRLQFEEAGPGAGRSSLRGGGLRERSL